MFHPFAASGADAVMQGDHSSTLHACPFLFFFTKVLFCADCFDANGVFDQTDLVPLLVTLIESLDGRAGKGCTLETKVNTPVACAILDPASSAMFGFAGILSVAPHAWFLLSKIGIANQTIHPTRSQLGRWYLGNHFHG